MSTRTRGLFALITAMLLAFGLASTAPSTASAAEATAATASAIAPTNRAPASGGGDKCYEQLDVEKSRWKRNFGGEKQLQGMEYSNGSWHDRQNQEWYTIPTHLNPPGYGQVARTGTVNVSNYGGPNKVVNYQYPEPGEQWYPSSDGWATEAEFLANATGLGWQKVVSKTFVEQGDRIPCVIPIPAQPSYADPCGPDNATWNVPQDSDKVTWTLDGEGNLTAHATQWWVFEGGSTSKAFGKAPDSNEPCPVLGIVVTDLPCAGPDGATVQFTVTYNGVDNKFSVIALRDGVMPIGGPEVTLVNGVGMGSISLPAGEYTLRAYHEYASDIIPPADVNLMVDDCDDEPTGSMTGWEDCAVGTPTAFFQFIGFGEGDHSVSYTVDGGRSFVDVNWNGDSSPVQSHAAEAGEDSVYIYAESEGFPEGWDEYTVGIDDDCPPSLEASGSGTVCGVEGSGVITANKPFTYAVVYIVYGPDGDEELVVEYNGDEVTEFPFTFTAREERESYHIAFNTMSGDESSQGSFTVVQGDDCETPPTTTVAPIVPDFDVECAQDGNGIVVTSRVGDIVVVFPAGSYPSMVIAAGESKTLPPVDGIVLYLADDTEYIIVLADVCVPAGPTTTAPPVTTAPPTTQPPSTDPPVDTSTTLPAPPTTVPPTPPAGELPATGAPTAITAIIAFVTILGGFGLLAVSRRRTA